MALVQKKGAAGPLCYLHAHLLREQITLCNGGGPGIRTPGTSRFNGFQDRRFRPLSQPTIIVPGRPGKSRALYRCAHFYQDFIRSLLREDPWDHYWRVARLSQPPSPAAPEVAKTIGPVPL